MNDAPAPDGGNPLAEACADAETIEILLPDISGMLRGKRVGREVLAKLGAGEFTIPGSTCLVDSTGQNAPGMKWGFDDGDPDYVCRPVPGSLRPVPWARRPMAQILVSLEGPDGKPFFADQRHVLERAVGAIAALGLRPVVAVELEFFLIDPGSVAGGTPRLAGSPLTGIPASTTQVYSLEELADFDAFLGAAREACERQEIPADTAISESAPGQFEINLRHVADAVLACDHAVLMKRAIRNVARRHGLLATFMAKPFAGVSGSGMHVHVSLGDEAGRNVFTTAAAAALAPALGHAVAGLLEAMPESMAFLAPNANSWRRFQAGSYAPTRAQWALDNRFSAIRIPPARDAGTRIEHRVAGADGNPYLVVAALLAGMARGLGAKTAPPAMLEAGHEAAGEPGAPLPRGWETALDLLEAGTILPPVLGEEFCAAYTGVRRFECASFNARIPPLDYEWYLATV